MDAYRVTSRIESFTGVGLTRGTVLRIENARGTLVRVECGTVWITQDGDPEDIILYPGQCFRLDCEGLALVSNGQSDSLALVWLKRPERRPPLSERIPARCWNFWTSLYAMPSRDLMAGL